MTDIATENKPNLYERYLAIIKGYLTQVSTDSALLINGEWGSGKTFFVKGELNKLITETLGKEIIYLSLFGISSVEDLRNELVSKCIKIGIKVPSKAKNIFNEGFEWLTGKKAESILGSVYIDSLDLSNKVLIFDDLERCETKLNEVLGFINEQIEHKKSKVILIADEANIKKEFQEEYNRRKEKLISRTIKFETDLTLLYDKIIEQYKENKDYFSFLQKQKDCLVTMCKEFELRNLRTFSFALGILKEVYEAGKDIERYPQESTETIILFVLSMSIEFKRGTLLSNQKYLFNDKIINLNIFDLFGKEGKFGNDTRKEEAIIVRNFKDKYTKLSRKYYYFDTIFDFIVNGYFDKNKYLTKDLNRLLPIGKSEEIIILDYFNKLDTYNIYHIDDFLFAEKINVFLQHIHNGDYNFYEYYNIVLLFIKWKDIMVNVNFFESVKIGINSSSDKSEFSYDSMIELSNTRCFLTQHDLLENTYKLIEEKHLEKVQNNNKSILYKLLDMLKSNECFDDFLSYSHKIKDAFDILSMLNVDGFIKVIPELSNKRFSEFFIALKNANTDNRNIINIKQIQNLILMKHRLMIFIKNINPDKRIRKYIISNIAIPIINYIIYRKDIEISLTLSAYYEQFRQTFSHLQAKNLHLQASYILDTEWFAMEFRFLEETTTNELEAIEIDLEAILAEENTTKEAFLQEVQQDKKIIIYDTETLYIFASPTLERWTPEHATQDARDILGLMFGSLPSYPQTV